MDDTHYGTLNDAEIKSAAKMGSLIIDEFIESNVKQACYEIRAGNIYFDLNNNIESGGEKHTIQDDDVIVFKPHQTIVIISKEKFHLPNDILARILTKGSLFSVGLSPVNTYADPGFFGHLGIVLSNISHHYLKVKCGEAIAKIEFERLRSPVEVPYHGQHSFETGIWPVRTDFIIKDSDINTFVPNVNQIEEIKSAYGKNVANIMERILITERRFIFASIVLIIVNLILISVSAGEHWLTNVQSAIVGIITNALFLILSLILSKIK